MRVLCAAFLFALFSCESAPQVQAYREDGLPVWVGQTFSNPRGIWAGGIGENGFYAWGEANLADAQSSLASAELDAKTRLKSFVCKEMAATENSAVLFGVQRADRFFAEDGTIYVLLFISKKNAKKSLKK